MIVTEAIDAKQNRDIMTLDIPNTFVQTGDPHQNGVERIMINIRGSLVDMLLEIVLEVYTDFVVYKRG